MADCRRLAAPASVDNIPTSAMQEDHVSMGWAAARKLRRVVDNFARVVAIEIMTVVAGRRAARAAPTRPRRPEPCSPGVRRPVPGIGPDRFLAPEIDLMTEMVRSGQIVAWAESVTGPLR